MPLYDYIASLAHYDTTSYHLPIPSFNIINGGAHSGNSLAVQEFMILPMGARTFRHSMRIAAEVYQTLKSLITQQYGSDSTNVGDEGGFAPNITNEANPHSLKSCVNSIYTALDLIVEAIKQSGYEGQVMIGMDVAASEFYLKEEKVYDVLKKTQHAAEDHSGYLTAQELLEVYEDLIRQYPIISIEDAFDEDDFEGWKAMKLSLGKSRIGGRQ